MIGSAAIGAAASFLGGDTDTPAMNYGDKLRKQLDYQKKYLKGAPSWQVEGAKAAGLHPLFAMGQSASAPTPSSVIPGQAIERPSQGQKALQALSSGLAVYGQLKSQERLNNAQADYYASMAKVNNQPGLDADKSTAGAVAQAFPYKGERGVPHTPPHKGPALVEVTQPDGTVSRIGNQDVGIENPEFLGAWYIFKDWARRKGVSFRNIAAKDLTRLYHSTKGLSANQIVDDLIRYIDNQHGAGVGDR